MSTAISIREQQEIQEWKSPTQIKQRIQAIRHLLETTLKQDVDYGVIPGTQKPTLYKSGSEQILAMFQIAVEPIVEDLSNEDCARYRVIARLTNASTEQFLGAGLGTCSSNETKYKWRKTYSKKEFDSTSPDRRKIKYASSRDGKEWEEMQVRMEPADVDNTILKMAKKRAQIDATLTVTGASSMFEQDLEDMTDETREEVTRERTPRKKPSPPPPKDVPVMCNECRATGGHLPHCSYRKKQEEKPQEQAQQQAQNPDTVQWVFMVEAVDERTDKKNKKYQMVTGVNHQNEKHTIYSWHTGETFDRLALVKPRTKCLFVVKAQKSGEKTYYSIEKILEITGEQKPQGELIPLSEEAF